MGWPSKLTDRELKRDSLLMSCTSLNLEIMNKDNQAPNLALSSYLYSQRQESVTNNGIKGSR